MVLLANGKMWWQSNAETKMCLVQHLGFQGHSGSEIQMCVGFKKCLQPGMVYVCFSWVSLGKPVLSSPTHTMLCELQIVIAVLELYALE